ncbi:hypothetical protein N9Z37_00300 [bacterium]|nr:hypothetical protein [bacterium]
MFGLFTLGLGFVFMIIMLMGAAGAQAGQRARASGFRAPEAHFAQDQKGSKVQKEVKIDPSFYCSWG